MSALSGFHQPAPCYPGPTPWRRQPRRGGIGLPVSLSRATWEEIWWAATEEERANALMEAAQVYLRALPAQILMMAQYRASKSILIRILDDDLARPRPVVPHEPWHDLEQDRRRGGHSVRALGITREQYDGHALRRGAMTTSEYLCHLVFAELGRRGRCAAPAPVTLLPEHSQRRFSAFPHW